MEKDNKLSIIGELAFNLAQAGVRLDQSRIDGAGQGELAQALEHNLQVWVELSVRVKSHECNLAEQVRDNLVTLCDFVADKTMKHGIEIPESTINTFVNINFQISEGLLEGEAQR